MNTKVCLKWAEALESGKYQQGTEALRVEHPDGSTTYCAFGVLCDLYDIIMVQPNDGTLWSKTGHGTYTYARFDYSTMCPVTLWAGLTDEELVSTVIDMNDSKGWRKQTPFVEIAEYVRLRVEIHNMDGRE